MNMKIKLAIVISVFSLFLISFASGQTISGEDYLRHVQSEAGLTQAFTWYRICNPSTTDYFIDDSSKFGVHFNEVKNQLSSYEFKILTSVSREVPKYVSQCNFYNTSVLANETNPEGIVTLVNCTSSFNSTIIENSLEWLPFNPIGQTLKTNSCYDIKIEGKYPVNFGYTAIDNVISYAGFNFNEFAWWNVSYNTSFTFWLKEPNGSSRIYMPLRVNITGLAGKVDNCSNGVLTQNISGSLVEIPSEIVLDRVSQGGSCYVRFLANLTANENASFVFFTNASVPRPKYLNGWTPQLWYNQLWGQSAFALWDDSVVSPNGTVIYDGLDARTGGWNKDYAQGAIVYDGVNRAFNDRGGSHYTFDASGTGGCGSSTQCKYCMYLNSTAAGDSSQGHHTMDALTDSGSNIFSNVYNYPGISNSFYSYNNGGGNTVSDYPLSKQWVWFCAVTSSSNRQVWIGPRSISNGTGTSSIVGRFTVTSNGDAGTYHWSKDRMVSNNTFNVYNESDYPIFGMGSEQSRVLTASEVEARTAIESGINSSVIGPSAVRHTDQKIYARNLSNAQVSGRFDKLASSGNQRWAFNYITGSDTNVNMFNLTPTLYTLEISENNSTSQITDMVGKLINNTKQ